MKSVGDVPVSVALRFWSRVERTSLELCWIWQGARIPDGYGMIHVGKRSVLAHRISWEIQNGPIPEGLEVCHHCDCPPCVNPSHLFLGTHSDNMQDMLRKGRANRAIGDQNGSRLYPERRPKGDRHPFHLHPERVARGDRNGARLHPETRARGEHNGYAKLTANQVREIRKLLAAGQLNRVQIGSLFGVTNTAIRLIATGKTWRHL